MNPRSFSLATFFLATVLSASISPPAASESAGDASLGMRLYRDGIRADGSPARATVQDGVALPGAKSGCVNCHRPSGFGSSEGGFYVPPITAPILFEPRRLDRNRLFPNMFEQAQPKGYQARLRQPHMRPGYTEDSLSRALASGIDAAGQPLDPIMPRYVLSDADVANLTAFLRGLSVTPDPGVTAKDLHLATIISADAPASERAAALATMEAYGDWANKRTSGYAGRERYSPYHHSDFADAYRLWRLHVWELRGPRETWRSQLDRFYSEQPVFAVIGGLVSGPFDDVADFCDASRLPCLFPNTDLPRTRNADQGYTFYFSRGLELEGEGLAAFLADAEAKPNAILEIVGSGPSATRPAAAFEHVLRTRRPQARLSVQPLSSVADVRSLSAKIGGEIDTVMIWPGETDDETIVALLAALPKTARILLPSSRTALARDRLTEEQAARVLLAHPHELPGVEHPLSYRVRAWMRTRKLDILEPRLQLQTYYALSLFDAGFGHLNTDFFRDYVIELIEHESEKDMNPGLFPTLTLGPGQRFASGGIYVVRLDPMAKDGVSAVSGWIVP